MGQWTEELERLRRDEPGAKERLYELVYQQLHRLARACAADGTLSPTALVHEAYLKLVGSEAGVVDRQHFMALAARVMRQIVVDHARRKMAARRQQPAGLEGELLSNLDLDEVLAVHTALTQLEGLDERLAQLVELRFFAGYTELEIASAFGVTDRTIRRDWRKARAYLYRAINGSPP